jgi:hypothetical protein
MMYFLGLICSLIAVAIHIHEGSAGWAALMGACAVVNLYASVERFADWIRR